MSILFASLSWPVQFVATGIIYFLTGLFSPKGGLKIKFVYYLLIISTHFLFYDLLALIIGNIWVSPIVIIPFISTGIGIWCIGLVRRKSLLIAIIAGLIYVSTIILGYWGMYNYLEYIFGLEKKPYINELKLDLYDSSGNSITEKDIKGKTAVLYFHTKSCAVCYKKLPDLESLYQDFIDDTNVLVIAVNIRLSLIEDTSYIMNHYRKSQYSFPQYISRGLSSDYEYRFNINGYPHLTIIGKNGDVIHNGRFNYDPAIFVDNAYKLVLSDIVNE
ncbi:MAG: TlpA family protein disulfide reductase [Bacteroidales bacterium]|nr:TlpA family protein disulfide reductase [Bacteroidales bacterium]